MSLDVAISSNQNVKSLARKLARRTSGLDSLTSEISVPATPAEWSAIAELGHILGVPSYQRAGKAVFEIPVDRRNPAAWMNLREVFTSHGKVSFDAKETFRRARLFAPGEVMDALKGDDVVLRFVRRGDGESREFLRLLEWAIMRMTDESVNETTTLSQVGSDILGDSKSLRSGTRREVFERVLSAVAGMDAESNRRDVLARLGIEDNPFTSSVTVFAPFSFSLTTGEEFDYPERLFHVGLAVQLPRQTVLRIREVRPADGLDRIVTSENAAPFERIVRLGVPCLYTEGYPNTAVFRLLELLSDQGIVADHAGDGDLDGFLIADQIAKAITVQRVIADELAGSDMVSRRPVVPRMRGRWEAYLNAHNNFTHARSLRIAIERGWPEQESYGDGYVTLKQSEEP